MRKCFNEIVDHGNGKYSLFGRVEAVWAGEGDTGYLRWAHLPIPEVLVGKIAHYAVTATITDSGKHSTYAPFLVFEIGDQPNVIGPNHVITLKAMSYNRQKYDEQYYCDYIVMVATR